VESRKLQRAYRDLNSNYEYALQNNSRLVQQNLAENKTMLERMEGLAVRLAAKEDSLKREQDRLTGLEEALELREQRVAELQSLISRKDSAAAYLRQRLADALLGFKDRGLTVSMRNGQVYVSLDNRLMFASGSWEVQPDGSSALSELAKVLNENKDLKIAVEGHTDSDEFNGKTAVKDNWDLSVMRATSVVKILVKQGVKPQRVQAAGRGEHLPVAPNDYPDGKAKNRRTEIIITPNLGELAELIQG
jgi:chemotaxis protein MotB